MIEFMREHPWMTFFLIVFGLLVLDNAIVNIVNTCRRKR